MTKNSQIPPTAPALSELEQCTLCPRKCGANRFRAPSGWCRTGAGYSVSSICIHRGEEPVLSGENGICNIFFSHCNLQCVYCQNGQISDNSTDAGSTDAGLESVVGQVVSILEKGIRHVGFVSPSHMIPQMVSIIRAVQEQGFSPVWVYNSNGYDDPETLRRLEGIIDVYLPDLKYMDPELAGMWSAAPDYPGVASRALREMFRQKGSALHLDADGMAESGLIVRHLVLPGAVANSLSVLRFLAEELSPKLHISLMSQYYPAHRVSRYPQLSRGVTEKEYRAIVQELEALGMENGWIQEFESQGFYRPDFNREHPFES